MKKKKDEVEDEEKKEGGRLEEAEKNATEKIRGKEKQKRK